MPPTDQKKQQVKVRLTKTGGLFGRAKLGTSYAVTAPKEITDPAEARVWAMRSMKRERPDENEMEWHAVVVTAHAD